MTNARRAITVLLAVGWLAHGVTATAQGDKFTARLAWVLIALNVVRLSIMVPLYLAEQVAALGVAKVVLGWPAYLLAITAMGAILLRGRTPIDPSRIA